MPHSPIACINLLESSPLIATLKQQQESSPGACEQCHRYKKKCSFGKAQMSCSRCIALDEQCRPRRWKRMGRRPVAQALPYGATSVLNLVSGNKRQTVHATDADKIIFHAARSTNPAENQRRHLNISRDIQVLSSPTCFRTIRPPVQSTWEVNVVLETTEGFFEAHRTFIIGRSFVDEFQTTVRRLFARSPQQLADAYYVALKLLTSRHAISRSLESRDLTIGSRCLQRLMDESSSIAHLEDAAVVLLLGQALLVYNTLIASPATQAITRGTLLSVKHWYPALIKQPYLDSVTLTPVLMDTIECLVRREVPVIRLSAPNRSIVDRFLGVRSSLLPLLYELCERSYESKTNALARYTSSRDSGEDDTYSEVERRIRGWSPNLPPCFFTMYSALEVSVMLAQARSYRIAALLIVHRLRFPFGTEDLVAQRYADDILRELFILKAWPHDAATGLGLDFPLLVATLELPSRGVDVYTAFEPLRFRRQHSDVILDFVRFVTAARENGYNGLWFDLVHGHLHGVILT